MRGKLGLVERFVDPPRFEVTSTTAFTSASGLGTESDPIVIVFSGNTSPSVNRRVVLVAKVPGVLKFAISADNFAQFAVDKNDSILFANAGSHVFFLPISIAVNDLVALYDYADNYSDDVNASFWIE